MYHNCNADFEKKEKNRRRKNVKNVIYKVKQFQREKQVRQDQKVNKVIQELVKKLKLLIQKQLIQVNWHKLKMNLLTTHII